MFTSEANREVYGPSVMAIGVQLHVNTNMNTPKLLAHLRSALIVCSEYPASDPVEAGILADVARRTRDSIRQIEGRTAYVLPIQPIAQRFTHGGVDYKVLSDDDAKMLHYRDTHSLLWSAKGDPHGMDVWDSVAKYFNCSQSWQSDPKAYRYAIPASPMPDVREFAAAMGDVTSWRAEPA